MDISVYLILVLMASIAIAAPMISGVLLARNPTRKHALGVVGASAILIFLTEKVHLEASSSYAVSASRAFYFSLWMSLMVGVVSLVIFLGKSVLTKQN